ncbi:MAG: hypothetical protein SFV23_20455 [Planctomycetaceae bacterium]|nr:hypothetical protein [Planctomycetaceae bacterium]
MTIQRALAYGLFSICLVASKGCGSAIKPIPEEQVKQSESAHAQIVAEERKKYQGGGPRKAHGAK